MVAEALLHELDDDGSQEGADVYSHVEDVVCPVFQRASFRVEVANHGRDVWFEESIADDQTRESGVDGSQRGKSQQQVARDEEQSANHHRATIAQLFISKPATN